MEKIEIVIIEDEFVIAEDMRKQLSEAGYDISAVFDRAEDALPFIQASMPDLLLVDIRLAGEMTGVDLVARLSLGIPVVYITANSDSATYEKAKITQPHAFLVKPFSPVNLTNAVDLALYNYSVSIHPFKIKDEPTGVPTSGEPFAMNQNLFVRLNGKYKKVNANDLLFIEASGSYINIQTEKERYTLSHNLTNFQKKTPLKFLLRVHRSYIINIDKVEMFEESFAFIKEYKIPISDPYKSEFLSRVHFL